jgi:hypothetical protein
MGFESPPAYNKEAEERAQKTKEMTNLMSERDRMRAKIASNEKLAVDSVSKDALEQDKKYLQEIESKLSQ